MGDNYEIDYWATKPTEEIGSKLEDKVKDFYQYIRVNGILDLWRRSYRQYFKAGQHLGGSVRGGSNNEYTYLYVNHYRSILQAALSMTVSQRPAFEARAVNNDYKSQAQTKLAQGLLDYYMREKRLERYVADAVEFAVWSGEGYVIQNWDVNLGKDYGQNENGAIIKEGDIRFASCSGIDIIRHPYLRKFEDRSWLIHREYVNKYKLAAQFPEHADSICHGDDNYSVVAEDFIDYYRVEDSDSIALYTFYHEDSESVPGGRYTMFIKGGIVLFDSPLPYPEIPIYSLHPSSIYGTPFGYSASFDMLPLQVAIDNLNSTIQTNQESFGVQNVLIPRGSNVSVEELGGGLNLVEYEPSAGKPEPMNLTATPAEIFNQRDNLIRDMETISGVNSVARGNPEASLKSGAALALVASQSVQFLQLFQQRYVQLLEDCGTGTINLLKEYASVPRVATIVGKMNTPYMKEFKGSDLENVNRIIVDMGNPLSKTTSGRIAIADSLMERGMLKSPDQYFTVLQTGRLEGITDPTQRQMMLIAQENEKLQMGENPQILITDNHALHIQEHKQVLDSPEARENPELVAVVLQHISTHIAQAQQGDPALFQILGYPPMAPPPPPQGGGSMPPVMDQQNPIMAEAANVQDPNMPTNPLTGQQYQTPSGVDALMPRIA